MERYCLVWMSSVKCLCWRGKDRRGEGLLYICNLSYKCIMATKANLSQASKKLELSPHVPSFCSWAMPFNNNSFPTLLSQLTFNLWNIKCHHLIFVNIIFKFVGQRCVFWAHSDPWPSKSHQFILEPKWTFVPNLKKFPQGVLEIM